MDLQLSGNVNFLPPGGSSNTNTPLAVAGTYGAQALATIDVPSGTPSGTSYALGFGSIANPIGFVVKNSMPSGGNIALAMAATGARQELAPGGVAAVFQPNRQTTALYPLTQAWVTIIASTTAAGTIEVMVFGD